MVPWVVVTTSETRTAIESVVRMESARLIAGLARYTGDVGLAEELAQDALVAALEQWPDSGVPRNAGAWLMTVGKRRAIDRFRRDQQLERKYGEIGRDLQAVRDGITPDFDRAFSDHIDDDVLRLVFVACHPVLSVQARHPHAPSRRRSHHYRDRARVPRTGVDDRATDRARQEDHRRRERSVRGAGRRRQSGAPVVGARSRLPHLQRGLLRDRGRRLDASRALRRTRCGSGACSRSSRPTNPKCTGSWR